LAGVCARDDLTADPAWRRYQFDIARLFRALRRQAVVDAPVQGVRARHAVDVLVEFETSGVPQRWVVECKHWQRRVGKAEVLALLGVMADVGASMGILCSETGFQPAAENASRDTNVVLTSLADLAARNSVELPDPAMRWQALIEKVESLFGALPDLLAAAARDERPPGIPFEDAVELQSLVRTAAADSAYEVRLRQAPRAVCVRAQRPLPTVRSGAIPIVVALPVRMSGGREEMYGMEIPWAIFESGFEELLSDLQQWRPEVLRGQVLLVPRAVVDSTEESDGPQNPHIADYRWVEDLVRKD
jgi:hypothetical protein